MEGTTSRVGLSFLPRRADGGGCQEGNLCINWACSLYPELLQWPFSLDDINCNKLNITNATSLHIGYRRKIQLKKNDGLSPLRITRKIPRKTSTDLPCKCLTHY